MSSILFNHILVPYNGCTGSQKSFKKAVGLAKLTKSKIAILTCLEKRSVFGMFKFKTDKKEISREEKFVMQEHEKLEKYANQQGLKPVFKIIKTNAKAESILEYAKSHDVDLIVMGMRKKPKYERLHYPSTIEYVSKNFNGGLLILN